MEPYGHEKVSHHYSPILPPEFLYFVRTAHNVNCYGSLRSVTPSIRPLASFVSS